MLPDETKLSNNFNLYKKMLRRHVLNCIKRILIFVSCKKVIEYKNLLINIFTIIYIRKYNRVSSYRFGIAENEYRFLVLIFELQRLVL